MEFGFCKEIVGEMADFDKKNEEVRLDKEELKLRKDLLLADYWRISKYKESLLCQKSRCKW